MDFKSNTFFSTNRIAGNGEAAENDLISFPPHAKFMSPAAATAQVHSNNPPEIQNRKGGCN